MSIFLKKLLVVVLFLIFNLQASETNIEEEALAKRIYAHLSIHDPRSGCQEAENALKNYPKSRILYEAYLHALSNEGNEKKLFYVWQIYKNTFENPYKREVLEAMAWGTLHASSQSSSPIIRLLAVLGAFYGQDADGVTILNKSLADTNALVRLAAVQLCSELREAKLGHTLLHLLKNEKNWLVKIECVKAIGEMKILSAKPYLEELLVNDNATEEEKAAVIKTLVKMYEQISPKQLELLAKSPKAEKRYLACQIIEHLDLVSQSPLLFSLLKDGHADVRSAALHAIGILDCVNLQDSKNKQLCLESLQDPHLEVLSVAAWALFPLYPIQVTAVFKGLILHPDVEIARMASGALAATGRNGVNLMHELFNQSPDMYVKLNLAMGMLQQRQYTEEACETLYNSIMESQEKWMWDEAEYFKFIAPSSVEYDELLPNYPEVINQMTRLEVLNSLAIMKFPRAQTAIRYCLQKKTIGISSFASAMLLTEGDEEAIDLVENLLDDPDQKIRLQAALVLALWGGSEKALDTLYKAYNVSDRSVKEKILEGLAKIGQPSSIPFLVEKLQEPFPTLRIIAAVALLTCLNH